MELCYLECRPPRLDQGCVSAVVPLMQVPLRGVTAASAEERSAGRKRLQARTPLARNDGEVFLQMLIGEAAVGPR